MTWGPGLFGVPELAHPEHAQDDLPGHAGPFDGRPGVVGEIGQNQPVPFGERHDFPALIPGIDELQDAHGLPPAGAQGRRQDGAGPVARLCIEIPVEGKRQGRGELIGVVDDQGLAGKGHITGQGPSVDGQGVAGIEIFVGVGPSEQGIVVDVSEFQDPVFHQIDGTGVGVGEAAGLSQHLVQEGVQVLKVVQPLHDVQQLGDEVPGMVQLAGHGL